MLLDEIKSIIRNEVGAAQVRRNHRHFFVGDCRLAVLETAAEFSTFRLYWWRFCFSWIDFAGAAQADL